MLKILVIEDDLHIAEMIKFVFEKDDYDITFASDGLKAIDYLEVTKFDLVITDIVMPSTDGYEVLEYMRDLDINTPTVILSSLNSQSNQLDGYKYNIEEYIVKPFNAELFKQKIDRILNRIYEFEDDGVVVNANNLTVTFNDDVIELTKLEFNLFYHLYINCGRVCTRYDLLLHFWNDETNDRVIDYTIKRIRNKLGRYSNTIQTKPKVGYMYEKYRK